MTEKETASTTPGDSPSLKLLEPDVLRGEPWHDDVLGRKEIANRLTNLISTQSVPFVVSVHGAWGTGKTFMLKRWQKDLEEKGFQAIYFNAWDDDFCDDPLIAIIGQLADYFSYSKYSGIKDDIKTATNSLFRRSSVTLSVGVASITTPLDSGQDDNDLLQVYLDQRKTKDTLKRHLEVLSARVAKDTGHPVVFIVDELDRCRPTFAIELLERVKHIFDIPELVFIFGINRDELGKSIRSIYGDIDADVYLQRFFDMEFTLPEAHTETFCSHLFEKFQLDEVFSSLGPGSGSRIHRQEFRYIYTYISNLWARLGLSLREIENCVRLVALLGRNLNPQRTMYPELIGVLIPLKSANPALYRKFVRGNCTGSHLMNYIDGKLSVGELSKGLSNLLDSIEVNLYLADSRFAADTYGLSPSIEQLRLLHDGEKLIAPHYLTEKTRSSDKARISRLLDLTSRMQILPVTSETIAYLVELIDMHQDTLRR